MVPSQTELLFDLGLDEEIVGITRFCVHPEAKCRTKKKIGGTKKFNFEVIEWLKPDLVLGNKEENYQGGIDRLKAKYPVWMSDVCTIADALEMIACVGQMTEKEIQAKRIIARINAKMSKLVVSSGIRVVYFIWIRPYMVAGRDTFINEMLKRCGFVNVFENRSRYPVVTDKEILAAEPDILLLSSEPFPFTKNNQREFEQKFPKAKSLLVDGTMFSWYGSRLQHAFDYFIELLKELEPSWLRETNATNRHN